MHPLAVAGVEPYASRLKAAPDELGATFLPEDIKSLSPAARRRDFGRSLAAATADAAPGAPVTDKGKVVAASTLVG